MEIKEITFEKIKSNPFPHGIYNINDKIAILQTLKPFDPRENHKDIEKAIGKRILTCKQIHSSIINLPQQIKEKCEGDGIHIPKNIKMAGGIVTADCLPVIIFSEIGITLVHCGWRGIAKGIFEKSISLHKDANEINVFIGNGICQNHYEVQSDVINHFLDYPNCFVKTETGYNLDIRCIIIEKSKKAGVSTVYSDTRCSYENDDILYSYRKDGIHAGRNMTIGYII